MSIFCKISGCYNNVFRDGYCDRHYKRLSKYKDTRAFIPNGLAKQFPREHNSWAGAKARCLCPTNKAYLKYGGRGIKICERWLGPMGFTNFLEDMGPKPSYRKFTSGKGIYTLDRIDNDGDYCPENCRWATAIQQTRNRKIVRRIEIEGEQKTIQEWATETGLSYATIHQRYEKGIRGKKLLKKPRKWERHK